MSGVPTFPVSAEMPQVCAVVLLRREDHAVLLQHRDEKPGLRASGQWVFPGGHREPGETLEGAAAREFLEETEYACRSLRWLASLVDHYEDGARPVLLHVFWEFYDGVSPWVCHEGQGLAFVLPEAAAELKIPCYLLRIWDLVSLSAGPSQK